MCNEECNLSVISITNNFRVSSFGQKSLDQMIGFTVYWVAKLLQKTKNDNILKYIQ